MAAKRYASFVAQLLTPSQSKWHGLKHKDDIINDKVQQYYSDITDLLFSTRYSNDSGFESALRKFYTNISVFGTSCMYIEDVPEKGLRYRTMNFGATYVRESPSGLVDGFLLRWDLTLRQIAAKFGEDALSSRQKMMLQKNPETEEEIWNIVLPINELPEVPTKFKGQFSYASVYFNNNPTHILGTDYYFSKPYICARINTNAGDEYGRSPATPIINSIALANKLQRDIVISSELSINPPIMVTPDAIQRSYSIQAGAFLHGAIGMNGEQLLRPLDLGQRKQDGFILLEQLQSRINDAFNLSLFQVLNDGNPQMTATEVLERRDEKYTLLAGELHQISGELFPDLIARELEILNLQGKLPEMPEELAEVGGVYDIQYESPFARMFGVEESKTINEIIATAMNYSQVSPEILDNIDFDSALRRIAKNSNLPAGVIVGTEQLQAIRGQRQIQQQQQQLAQQLPALAQAEKTAAETDVIEGAI